MSTLFDILHQLQLTLSNIIISNKYRIVHIPNDKVHTHSKLNTVTSYLARRHLNSSASRLFTQTFNQPRNKENIKAPPRWPFLRRIQRWFPRPKGHERGKCFHLMTTSWLSSNSYHRIAALTFQCVILDSHRQCYNEAVIIWKRIRLLYHMKLQSFSLA